MTLTTVIADTQKEFVEKFVDVEGCQAGHGTQEDCIYCLRWGGAQGEPKYNKRCLGNSGQIQSFLTQAMTKAAVAAVEGFVSKQEVYQLFQRNNIDIESGIEYLNGIEFFRIEDIERFINR